MNIVFMIPLDIVNSLICVALSVHGICTINHFTQATPCLMRVGVALFTVGCAGVAIGPFYGFVTADPAEVVMNAGLLVYAMRKELMLYVNRKAENNEATS